ncbi:MAG: hypothetical protein PVJ02_06825 [Gemmatimonadota bacterium]
MGYLPAAMKRLCLSILCLAVIAALSSCGQPEEAPQRPPATGAETPVPGNFRGRVYERNFVFTTLSGDSAFMVPWLMSAHTRPGGVDRRARGWLARGLTWDAFYDESWTTPPTRSPWRILPHGSLRLIVGDGDAIEGILFSQGARELELEVTGGPLIEWTGTQDQVFRLLDGGVYLSDQKVAGIALDMTRVRGADQQEGDWAFLVSGDSLQVVLENPTAAAPGTTGGYQGWARLDFRDLQWPDITLDWTEVRAFQPARQDVPVSWAVTSGDDAIQGSLEVLSAQIQAGQGDGPVLPVDALFLVSGTLQIQGGDYPVRGLFRHTRP